MTETTVAQEKQQEGMLISDQQGVVIAWRDGHARRFSWELLRHLSVCEDCQQQSDTRTLLPTCCQSCLTRKSREEVPMSFYIKRSYVDTQPGIELVNIHYTWTPVGQQPDWEAHRETRAMPRGGVLIKGMGGTTVAESGEYVQTMSQTVELPDDGIRRKVIRLPEDVLIPPQDVRRKLRLSSLL